MSDNTDNMLVDHLIESDGLAAAKAALTRVRLLPHPFSIERVEKHVESGQTIYEIMGAAGCTPGRSYIVLLNGRFIPSEMWKRVRPKVHAEVIIKAVPMGGGGDGDQNKTLRTVLQIVIVIVAIVIIIATSGSATPWVVTAGLWAAGAVSVVGNLAIAALLPPKFNLPKPSGRAEPGFSISGARNQAAPGGPIPKVYGRHRLFPFPNRRPT